MALFAQNKMVFSQKDFHRNIKFQIHQISTSPAARYRLWRSYQHYAGKIHHFHIHFFNCLATKLSPATGLKQSWSNADYQQFAFGVLLLANTNHFSYSQLKFKTAKWVKIKTANFQLLKTYATNHPLFVDFITEFKPEPTWFIEPTLWWNKSVPSSTWKAQLVQYANIWRQLYQAFFKPFATNELWQTTLQHLILLLVAYQLYLNEYHFQLFSSNKHELAIDQLTTCICYHNQQYQAALMQLYPKTYNWIIQLVNQHLI